jgi:hypothetical protein
MRSALILCSMMAIAGTLALGALAADDADADKPKYSIKDVMKEAHKGDAALLKKVAAGDASAEEKKQLLELYQALAKNEPPKGDAASWKEKTDALVAATVKGDADAPKKLKAASNCGACHKVHKGS